LQDSDVFGIGLASS